MAGESSSPLPKEMLVSPGRDQAGHSPSARLGLAPRLRKGHLRVLRPGTRAGLVSITEKLRIAAEHPCRLARM